MVRHSNSQHDIQPGREARRHDEEAVRSVYEKSPYPDLGTALKSLAIYLDPLRAELERRTNVRFLDVGCGTGHVAVGVAKKYPEWAVCALDLSNASLEIARELAKNHATKVDFRRGSYLDPLPFEDGPFDIISCMGTIHHCAEPVAAMRTLRSALKDDGWMLLHLYGWRIDRGKFDLKEILSVFEPNLENVDRRFQFYDALMRHRRGRWIKRMATTSPLDVYIGLRTRLRNIHRSLRKISWSPSWTANYDEPTAPWIDHFCHPCERAYEVLDVRELLEASGFEVVRMLRQGQEYRNLIPSEWRPAYERLGEWEKRRLSELLAEGGTSFSMVLRKVSSPSVMDTGPLQK